MRSCTGKTEKVSLPYISGDPICWTETEYDGIGRPTKVIPPDGSPTSNDTEYKYGGVTLNDRKYRIRAVFDAKGVGKAWVTDAAGDLVQARENVNYSTLSSSTVTDYSRHPDSAYTFGYSLRWNASQTTYTSQIVYVSDYNYSEIYQGAQTRTFKRDSLGRVIQETHPENGTTSYVYDDNGWLLTKTDARGVVSSTNYDGLGRPTQISYSDSTPTATYTYDTGSYGIGRLHETSNANATTTYFYNQKGQVTGIDKTIGSEDFAISYTRNYVGQATSTMLPNGTTISYTRDRAQRLTGVASDWVDSNHPATLATNFVYNAAGAVTRVEYGNGTVSTRTFNTGMQLKTLEYGTTADPDAFLDFEYDYDEGVSNTGQIMQITDHIDTTKTISYTYDDFYRLKTAQTQGSHWGLSWTYDRYGNRLAQSLTKGSAPSNTLSVSTSTNRVTTWSYDSAGNVTNDGDFTYSFDANNMIKDVDGGNTAVYKYDVNGQRVMKTIGSETIYYVFGVGEYSSVSGWDKVYVHLGRKKLLEYSGGMTYFYGTDHLATPRVQTDISATVTETWSSYPYGEEWEQSGPGTEENRFTGHLKDDETGLHYAGARFLDDKSRWLSVDRILGDSSNPQRLNRFSYALSDPVNWIDPDGGEPCTEEERHDMRYGIGYTDKKCTSESHRDSTGRSGGAGPWGGGGARSGAPGGGGGAKPVQEPPVSRFAPRDPPELDDSKMALFWCLYKKSGFGGFDQEQFAFIVEASDGSWSLWRPPASADRKSESYSGPVPDGTVGIVHTHPQEDPLNIKGLNDQQALGLHRNVSGGIERIQWNYILHRDGIGVISSKGSTLVKERFWWKGLEDTDCEGKINDFKPPK